MARESPYITLFRKYFENHPCENALKIFENSYLKNFLIEMVGLSKVVDYYQDSKKFHLFYQTYFFANDIFNKKLFFFLNFVLNSTVNMKIATNV